MKNYTHNSINIEQFEIDLKELKDFKLDPKSDRVGSQVTTDFRQFEVLEHGECTE